MRPLQDGTAYVAKQSIVTVVPKWLRCRCGNKRDHIQAAVLDGIADVAPVLLDGIAYVAPVLMWHLHWWMGFLCGDVKPMIMSSYSLSSQTWWMKEKNPHQSDKFDHVTDQCCSCDVTEGLLSTAVLICHRGYPNKLDLVEARWH